MTVPSTARRAGPFSGNGVTTTFSFSFKTFAAGDLQVTRMDALGLETTLVLNSDYSVSLNVDQDTSPGGTITYPISGSPLPAGQKLTIIGDLDYEQTTDLLGGGAFNAKVIEDTFDRTVIQIQQLEERLDRALLVPVNSTANVQLPNPEANELIGWDSTGSNLTNYQLSQLATGIAYGTTRFDTFTGDGTTTQFALTEDPAALANLDVSISGVTQVPGTDYTLTSATLVFTTAPANGTKILARYGRALPVSGPVDSSAVTYQPAGSGSIPRTVQSRLRDVVSVFDFMTSAQIADVQSNAYSVDVSGAVQAAIDANATNGAYLWFPLGTYRFDSGVTLPPNATARWVFDAPLGTVIRTSNAITLISRTPTNQTNADQIIQVNTLAIRNLTFRGSLNSGQTAISIGATYGAVIENCYFFALGRAVVIRFGLKTFIHNCFFFDNTTDSIVLDYGNWTGATNSNSQSNISTISSCRVYNRTGANSAFYIRAASGVAVRDSVIEGLNPVYGIFFDSFGATVVKDFTIDNLHVECIPTAAAIYLKGAGGCCSIRNVFMQGTLSAGAYLIDNSQFYGTPISVDFADIPFLVGANPAGYIFKTTYTSVWSITDPAGIILFSQFESINAPLEPGIIIITGAAEDSILRMQGTRSSIAATDVFNLSAGNDTNLRSNRYLRLASNLSGADSVRIDIQRGNGEIDFVSTLVKVNGTTCPQSTSFTTADGKTVQVRNGFITSVV